MNIKRNILYFLDIEKDKPDAKIRMRIRYAGGYLVNFNVGYRADIDKWVKEVQQCKKGTTHGRKRISATEINIELQRLYKLAEDTFKSFELDEHIPNPDEFRKVFNDANAIANGAIPNNGNSFFEIFDLFVSVVGNQNQWTLSTYNKFSTLRKHLVKYNPKLTMTRLSESDLHGFTFYMSRVKVTPPKRGVPDRKQQIGLRNTTISKNVALLRWFLGWAQSRGYYEGNLHIIWKPKLKGTDGNNKEIIYLNWDELMKLLNQDIPEEKQYLSRIRDVFCFQCFTGLRYSDVAKLTRSDLKDGYIQIVTQKTNDGLRIELNKYSRAILEKYDDIHFENERVFPVISNVNMNIYLKELARLAGITEPQKIVYYMGSEAIEEVYPKCDLITTHAARRTFVVNALTLGIPSEVIMRWTGHSDFKSMKPYTKIVDELKAQEMAKFDR